jgi:hypothetical protein
MFTDVCNFVAFTANYSINHTCNLHHIRSLDFDTVKPHYPGLFTGPNECDIKVVQEICEWHYTDVILIFPGEQTVSWHVRDTCQFLLLP